MERVVFDYSKLRGRIKEKCNSQKVFAQRVGSPAVSMSQKLNCHYYFTQKEILKIASVLEIADGDIGEYFFTQKVQ